MKRFPLVLKSEGILLNRNEVMRARKAQQAVHWARKRASPGKLRNPDEDRIVLIEDSSEIHLEKPNLFRFEARQDVQACGRPPIASAPFGRLSGTRLVTEGLQV